MCHSENDIVEAMRVQLNKTKSYSKNTECEDKRQQRGDPNGSAVIINRVAGETVVRYCR